jgi:hypothetical protein
MKRKKKFKIQATMAQISLTFAFHLLLYKKKIIATATN